MAVYVGRGSAHDDEAHDIRLLQCAGLLSSGGVLVMVCEGLFGNSERDYLEAFVEYAKGSSLARDARSSLVICVRGGRPGLEDLVRRTCRDSLDYFRDVLCINVPRLPENPSPADLHDTLKPAADLIRERLARSQTTRFAEEDGLLMGRDVAAVVRSCLPEIRDGQVMKRDTVAQYLQRAKLSRTVAEWLGKLPEMIGEQFYDILECDNPKEICNRCIRIAITSISDLHGHVPEAMMHHELMPLQSAVARAENHWQTQSTMAANRYREDTDVVAKCIFQERVVPLETKIRQELGLRDDIVPSLATVCRESRKELREKLNPDDLPGRNALLENALQWLQTKCDDLQSSLVAARDVFLQEYKAEAIRKAGQITFALNGTPAQIKPEPFTQLFRDFKDKCGETAPEVEKAIREVLDKRWLELHNQNKKVFETQEDARKQGVDYRNAARQASVADPRLHRLPGRCINAGRIE